MIDTPQQFTDEEGNTCFKCCLCEREFVRDNKWDGTQEFRQHTVQTDPQSVCEDCYHGKVVPWLKKNGYKVP